MDCSDCHGYVMRVMKQLFSVTDCQSQSHGPRSPFAKIWTFRVESILDTGGLYKLNSLNTKGNEVDLNKLAKHKQCELLKTQK